MVSMEYGERLEAALATQIKIELVERGWSQETLATAVGIERATLTRYMTGKRSMPMPTFFKVAEALGLTPPRSDGACRSSCSARRLAALTPSRMASLPSSRTVAMVSSEGGWSCSRFIWCNPPVVRFSNTCSSKTTLS